MFCCCISFSFNMKRLLEREHYSNWITPAMKMSEIEDWLSTTQTNKNAAFDTFPLKAVFWLKEEPDVMS